MFFANHGTLFRRLIDSSHHLGVFLANGSSRVLNERCLQQPFGFSMP